MKWWQTNMLVSKSCKFSGSSYFLTSRSYWCCHYRGLLYLWTWWPEASTWHLSVASASHPHGEDNWILESSLWPHYLSLNIQGHHTAFWQQWHQKVASALTIVFQISWKCIYLGNQFTFKPSWRRSLRNTLYFPCIRWYFCLKLLVQKLKVIWYTWVISWEPFLVLP